MAYRMWKSSGIPGVGPAPLIREKLGASHLEWLKIKKDLAKEMPLLTQEELIEEVRQQKPPDEIVLSNLVSTGYRKSAEEIVKLIRSEQVGRKLTVKRGADCQKQPLKLEKDLKKLKMLAAVFSDCEKLAREGLWRDLILLRMRLAKSLFKSGSIGLMKQIVQSCIEYGQNLDDSDKTDKNLKAEANLLLAFLMTEYEDNETYWVEASKLLHDCRQLTEATQTHRERAYLSKQTEAGRTTPCEMIRVILDRPIGLHGWRGTTAVQDTEVMMASDTTPYYAASVLLSRLMVSIASKMFCRGGDKNDDKEGCNDPELLKSVENLYKKATFIAAEGQNHTNYLDSLYVYGTFCFKVGDLDQAKKVFLRLHFNALSLSDFETIGIAFNGLGQVSIAQQYLDDALGNFCDEWEMGCKHNLPALVVDSIMEIGRILLEEGKLLKAEQCCKVTFDQYTELIEDKYKSLELNFEEQSKGNGLKKEMSYEHSWAMAGIATGQSLLGRLVGHSRRNDSVYNILKWKNNRAPLPAVPCPTYRPTAIQMAQKHCDVKYLSQKHEDMENSEYENEIQPMTNHEHLKDWIQLVEEDDYQFTHDADNKAYRDRVISKTFSINRSLVLALGHEDNLLLKDLKRSTAHNVRTSYIEQTKQSNISFHEQRIQYTDLSDDDYESELQTVLSFS